MSLFFAAGPLLVLQVTSQAGVAERPGENEYRRLSLAGSGPPSRLAGVSAAAEAALGRMAAAMITAPLEVPTPTAWPQSPPLAIFAFVASSLSSLPTWRGARCHIMRYRAFKIDLGSFIMNLWGFSLCFRRGLHVMAAGLRSAGKWQRRIFSERTARLGFYVFQQSVGRSEMSA